MPSTGVEAVRRFFGAWTERDVPGMLAVVDPEVVVRPLLALLYGRHEYHGHEGIREWVHESDALGDRFEVEVEDTRVAGDGVAAFVRIVVHEGEASYDARIAVVCELRGGLIATIAGRDAEETTEAIDRAPSGS